MLALDHRQHLLLQLLHALDYLLLLALLLTLRGLLTSPSGCRFVGDVAAVVGTQWDLELPRLNRDMMLPVFLVFSALPPRRFLLELRHIPGLFVRPGFRPSRIEAEMILIVTIHIL